jgi:hypothetical protein
VFYAGGVEVFRVSWLDVLGVTKSRVPPAHTEEPTQEIWL